ncbi:MAG: hypothetical protein H7123_00965 [Thermoleophilia bacterium]|nr:hypothetical protein [Thermoleophilia bacterium]
MTDHPTARQLVDALVTARTNNDDQTARALVAPLDDDQLIEVMDLLDAAPQHSSPAEPIDIERLHTALREAGSTAVDALVWSDLAAGYPAPWLRAQLDARQVTVGALVDRMARPLACDVPAQQHALARYLQRIVEGRHDLRRVTDEALGALATAADISIAALSAVREQAAVPQLSRLSAARGATNLDSKNIPASSTAQIDQLFLGRDVEPD